MKRYFKPSALILISSIAYIWLAYGMESRTQFPAFLACIGICFLCYRLLLNHISGLSFRQIFVAGLFLRLIFIAATPLLSDDYFRYLWDGHLVTQGINPYNQTPTQVIVNQGEIASQWLNGMNSSSYYSIYPPLVQFAFAFSSLGIPGGTQGCLILLHLLVIGAEALTMALLAFNLREAELPVSKIAWYAFNPLVIVELAGNVHTEAFLIPFLLATLLFLKKSKIRLGAVFFGLAIAVKLWPLILLPFMWFHLGARKGSGFTFISIVISLLSFAPMVNPELLFKMSHSVDLYFRHFEFNASVYYMIREVTMARLGHHVIHWLGPLMAVACLLAVVTFGWSQRAFKGTSHVWMNTLMIYLMLALVVHPWYITPMVALSVFTGTRTPLVWSGVVILSYHTYASIPYRENLWVTAGSYAIVLAFFLWERRALRALPT